MQDHERVFYANAEYFIQRDGHGKRHSIFHLTCSFYDMSARLAQLRFENNKNKYII
jgi:hypothetical protein